MLSKLGKLVLCIVLCEAVGLVGGLITAPEITTWYAGLAKPWWTPPNGVFPYVWSTLYALMAIALWLLWDRAQPGRLRTLAIGLFFVQLALNAAWSPVFFGLHATRAALAIIALLFVVLLATILAAARVNQPAALLLVPYAIWIGYAATLNGGIVALNA